MTTSDFRDPRLTEQRNPRTERIDVAGTLEIVDLMNAEDASVAGAVRAERQRIAQAIDLVVAALQQEGRLVYVGAGTSGRLGVLDAAECPPTFGTPPTMVVGVIAGGYGALVKSVEGAEDDVNAGAAAMDTAAVTAKDVVVGIAASGTTPYVGAALARAQTLGAKTALVTCSTPPKLLTETCDVVIVPVVGPEALTGSTRLKAGTATKLVLNTISTGAMIRLGKVYGNLMVDLMALSAKLKDRGERVVMECAGVDRARARAAIEQAGGSVKLAIVMAKKGIRREEAQRVLDEAGGFVRRAAGDPPPVTPPPPVTQVLAVGLMSGTSLDGVSTALVRLEADPPKATLVAFRQEPYGSAERGAIIDAMARGTPRDLAFLHVALGERFAGAVLSLLADAKVSPKDLAFIASHGQTVWHEPGRATLQLGDAAVLAERLGVRVVSDFRARDVAAGGQGAPLVSLADVMLFGHEERGRLLLNIGGIANVTWVPRRGVTEGALAFDTGPGVGVMDSVTRRVDPDAVFDQDGERARRGRPVQKLLEELLADPYFEQPPPKSTGRERFGIDYADRLLARVRAAGGSENDAVATATALTAESIARSIARWPGKEGELVISGGGAKNPALVERLATLVQPRPIVQFEQLFFEGEAKEAVAFAFLGHQTILGRAGNLPAATGARGPRVLGHITPA